MSSLTTHIANLISSKLNELTSSSETAREETRLIFYGPPMELLEPIFDQLVQSNNNSNTNIKRSVPILLNIPNFDIGKKNPKIGESGRCDDTHLLNLRNSPSRPSYLALLPPGQHSIKSVSSTTDEFGVRSTNSGGNIPFDEWWADEFIQSIVIAGITQTGITEDLFDEAIKLVEFTVRAEDDLDWDRISRRNAWYVISSLFSSSNVKGILSSGEAISLACGIPPLKNGKLSAKEQLSSLSQIAEALADGFRTGIDRIKLTADVEDHNILEDFYLHISQCDVPTAFERSISYYYNPNRAAEIVAPPLWWRGLTVEKWTDLLADDTQISGDIKLLCSNSLFVYGKAMPAVVKDNVDISIQIAGLIDTSKEFDLERTPSGPQGKVIANFGLSEQIEFTDNAISAHRSPLKYKTNSDDYKNGILKVISLSQWIPGVLIICRLAKKYSHPKKPSRGTAKKGPEWESSITLPGTGRYEFLIFTSPEITLNDHIVGSSDSNDEHESNDDEYKIHQVKDYLYQIEAEIEGNYQLDLTFTRNKNDGVRKSEVCRVFITCDEIFEEGVRNEYERLIKANRRNIEQYDSKAIVQLDRSARSSSLQEWMLSPDSIMDSYKPIVIAEDYADRWAQISWALSEGPILSSGKFIQDPRPEPDEFNPPAEFLKARKKIAERIRGDAEQLGLCESARLGDWLAKDDEFRSLVEQYLESYDSWLASDPDIACWVDVVAVVSHEPDGRTLARIPDAILLSPLHPIRIAWHSCAQKLLLEADEKGKPCPAASVLDPDCIIDTLSLSCRSPDGVEKIDFLAVENGTDYWSVLWNGQKLNNLPNRSRLPPFDHAFGITIGGISLGFSAAQVTRALANVSELLSAKSILGITIGSAGGTTDSCNEGLINWCTTRLGSGDNLNKIQGLGNKLIEIYDTRDEICRPDDAEIANLTEDTKNAVRWYLKQPDGTIPDLGIIAQLDMSEPRATETNIRSPLGFGGLLRHRIRRQLRKAFLNESRQSLTPRPSGEVLPDKLARSISTLENIGDRKIGLEFAPNVNVVGDMLELQKTDFVAVSSSAIDPACFLGGWLQGTYLWDYDLPSYSHRAGDSNGYYLLSQVKEADRDALYNSVKRLPNCSDLSTQTAHDMLLEVARRGIPTIRGLSQNDSGATGDLGLFIAVRLLQDRFRINNHIESLLKVIGNDGDFETITLIIPVDPFKDYIEDITRSLRKDHKDFTFSRPDLIVFGIKLSDTKISLHVTPIEVKCRSGAAFPINEFNDALDQAKSLSKLLNFLLPSENLPKIWTLAFQHLLLSMVGFGMRVYSQQSDVMTVESRWANYYEKIAEAIMCEGSDITIDKVGRLIVIDNSSSSKAVDKDGDKFEETIIISQEDAGKVVAGDPTEFYASVKKIINDWQLLPSSTKFQVTSKSSEKHDPSLKQESEIYTEPLQPISQLETPATSQQAPAFASSQTSNGSGIIIEVGRTTDGFRQKDLFLNISDTRLNQLNIGVVGDLGTGKTQLLKSLITQISRGSEQNRGKKPKFLIFDYKRDYSSNDFVQATNAKVISPRKLPLNLFDTKTIIETTAPPWLDRFRFFSDVLDKIYSNIGPVQRDKLKRAVKRAYEIAGSIQPPTLDNVYSAYLEILDGGNDSVASIMSDLVDMEIFASEPSDTQTFDEFLDGVVVISLDKLGQDDQGKNMLVAVMLNMFYEYMLRVPKFPFEGTDPQLRAIDSYLLVDEADNIMRYEFDVLRKLLLQGREFGVGVILASQYLRHFKARATDYREPLLTWFIHKVPNITPTELSALGLTADLSELTNRIKDLQVHHCLYKSFDSPGEEISGLPFFKLA